MAMIRSWVGRHRRLALFGGLPAAVLLGALVFWMVRPLFDDGTRLREAAPFPVASDSRGEGAAPSGAAGSLVAAGRLKGMDAFHFGSGEVRLLRGPSGDLVLRFEGYEVRNGPDLFVYLTHDAGGDVRTPGTVNLGAIKATSGDVNYEVPRDLDLTKMQHAVIWCRAFSVLFASAPLSPAGM